MVDNSIIDQETGYQLVIFLSDHGHPHVHIYLNGRPLAKILLDTAGVLNWWTQHQGERKKCLQALLRNRGTLQRYWDNIHGENEHA